MLKNKNSDIYPKFSIVTVCFNATGSIADTIDSVIEQDYTNFEYIIIDGGSTDGTLDIINRYADHIDTVISQPDRGIYDAMNKATRLASGHFIIFMNAADRFYSNDTLSRIAAAAEPDDTVIYGDVAKMKPDGTLSIRQAEPPHNSHRMFFCHQSAATARQALLEHPFDITHKFSADFKLYKQLIKAHARFKKVDFPIALFDTGGISNTRRSDGLSDNLKVLRETDSLMQRIKLAPRLLIPLLICRLRGK